MTVADHSLAERRSLRYHAAVAEHLLRDESILPRVRARVDEWIANGSVARYYADGWKQILAGPMPALLAFVCDPSERARAFRQVSPFAGVLSPRERWRLWAEARESDDETAARTSDSSGVHHR